MSHAWETWLEARFPAYLLRCAEGRPHPAAAVAQALTRLAGDPGSLHQLAALAFLLDPGSHVEALVCTDLPNHLRRAYPRSERVREELHGRVRGRIDWARTLILQQQTRDPARAITTSLRRTFASPELLLVRWLVDRIRAAAATLGPSNYARDDLWVARLARIHAAADTCLRHAALRDLPLQRPDAETLRLCHNSRDPAIRRAADIARAHARLLPHPNHEHLRDALARYALVPYMAETRFELYILLALLESIDRAWPDATRHNTIIASRRKAIAIWRRGSAHLSLFYNQGAQPGAYAGALRHAYDAQSSLRPDLRLVYRDPTQKVELLLDAKLSDRLGYLRASYLKMHGYIADRPAAFKSAARPQVIILANRPLTRPPVPTDPVVFLDPDSCSDGGPLDHLILHWLAHCQPPVTAGP
jgi:hypothetical protein